MKRFITFGLILVSSLIIVGCGNDGSDESSGDTNEVTMWVHNSKESAEGQVWEELINKFNEENEEGYKATIDFIPRSGSGGGYEDKINAALTTNTLPDVLTLDGPNTAAYAESGIIAPIDEYISNKDDFLPSILEQGTYDEKLYAIGYSESGVGIYYNKEMLEEAGVDLATLPTVDNPWDWNQFLELAETLTDYYGEPAIDLGLNDKSEWLMYAFTPFLWSQGGDIVSEDGTTAEGVFNDENAVKTFSFIQEMVEKGYTTISPSDKAFETGKYPMKLSGSWTIQEMEESYQDVDYGIMPYPVSPETGELVSPTGSWQYAMSATTDKKDAAGALIDFLVTTESLLEISLGNSVLPARYSTAEEMEDKVSEQMNVLIEQNTKTGKARPVLPEYPQVSRVFQQAVSDAALYDINSDIQQLLDDKATQIQDYLDK